MYQEGPIHAAAANHTSRERSGQPARNASIRTPPAGSQLAGLTKEHLKNPFTATPIGTFTSAQIAGAIYRIKAGLIPQPNLEPGKGIMPEHFPFP